MKNVFSSRCTESCPFTHIHISIDLWVLKYERARQESQIWRRRCGNGNRVWNDAVAGRGPGAKGCRKPPEAGKGKETIFF